MHIMIKDSFYKRLSRFLSRYCYRITHFYFYKNYFKFKRLKDKYKGERAFIIGNGPSLNQTPLYLLKNEYTFAFNRFNLMLERIGWLPNFYMVDDAIVAEDMQEEVSEMIKKTQMSFFPDVDKLDNRNFLDFISFDKNVYFLHQDPVKFSNFLPHVGTGGTVIYPAFQILKYLGFDEIFFIGVDVNYKLHKTTDVLDEKEVTSIQSKKDDDPNHFDPRYFGKGRKYHQPDQTTVDRILSGLNFLAEYFSKTKCKVYNAGYNSNVKSFQKMDFIQALGYSEDEIKSKFEDLINGYGIDSFLTLESESVEHSEDVMWSENKVIKIKLDEALNLIKEKILTHLPLGPFDNHYYFLNRDFIK